MSGSANWLLRRLRLLHPGASLLARRWDRIEAVLLVLATGLLLATVPVALAIGSAVYDGQSAVARQQTMERHPAMAVTSVDAPNTPLTDTPPVNEPYQVSASWTGTDGAKHTGRITVDPSTPVGSAVPIWLDRRNQPVPAPDSPAAVLGDAVGAALFAGICCVLAAVGLLAGGRAWLDRRRVAEWTSAWERFSGKPSRS